MTEPWKDNIRVYAGDITKIGWSGGPIEFLFVDVMKALEQAKIDQLSEENDSLRTKATLFHDADGELRRVRSDFDVARNRITAMESSKFWKLRRHWFRVKRALHIPGWETE